MKSKTDMVLVIAIGIVSLLLVVSASQYLMAGSLTFRCGSECPWCVCKADYAIVTNMCCGYCFDQNTLVSLACCDECNIAFL